MQEMILAETGGDEGGIQLYFMSTLHVLLHEELPCQSKPILTVPGQRKCTLLEHGI